MEIFSQVLVVSEYFDNCPQLVYSVRKYLSNNISLIHDANLLIDKFVLNKHIEEALIDAAVTLNLNDTGSLETYVGLLMRVYKFTSVFQLLSKAREFIHSQGDLTSKNPALIFHIPVIDLNIN